MFFWFISTDYFGSFFLRILEDRFPVVLTQDIENADAAVVLGGMSSSLNKVSDRIEFDDAVDRILLPVYLLQRQKIKSLILSGGSGLILQTEKPESFLLKEFLINFQNLSETKIFVDTRSKNTYENIIETLKIIRQNHIKKIYLVTSAFHMYRAYNLFQKQIDNHNLELKVIPLPVDYRSTRKRMGIEDYVPSHFGLAKTTIAFKEYIGILAYFIREYL